MAKSGCLLLLILLAGSPSRVRGQSLWASWTASFKAVSYSTDSNEQVHKILDQSTEVTRAADGSELTLTKDDQGKIISGLLHKAEKVYALNYTGKVALIINKSHHLAEWRTPLDSPIGTVVVQGINCVIYPLHVNSGEGNMCVNSVHQLVARQYIRSQSGGVTQVYTKELTSINFAEPPLPTLDVPNGFKVIPLKMAGDDQ